MYNINKILFIIISNFQLDKDGFVVLEDFLQPAECDELVAAGIELTKEIQNATQKSVFSAILDNPVSKTNIL